MGASRLTLPAPTPSGQAGQELVARGALGPVTPEELTLAVRRLRDESDSELCEEIRHEMTDVAIYLIEIASVL
jgi:hypothetical protein